MLAPSCLTSLGGIKSNSYHYSLWHVITGWVPIVKGRFYTTEGCEARRCKHFPIYGQLNSIMHL